MVLEAMVRVHIPTWVHAQAQRDCSLEMEEEMGVVAKENSGLSSLEGTMEQRDFAKKTGVVRKTVLGFWFRVFAAMGASFVGGEANGTTFWIGQAPA